MSGRSSNELGSGPRSQYRRYHQFRAGISLGALLGRLLRIRGALIDAYPHGLRQGVAPLRLRESGFPSAGKGPGGDPPHDRQRERNRGADPGVAPPRYQFRRPESLRFRALRFSGVGKVVGRVASTEPRAASVAGIGVPGRCCIASPPTAMAKSSPPSSAMPAGPGSTGASAFALGGPVQPRPSPAAAAGPAPG